MRGWCDSVLGFCPPVSTQEWTAARGGALYVCEVRALFVDSPLAGIEGRWSVVSLWQHFALALVLSLSLALALSLARRVRRGDGSPG